MSSTSKAASPISSRLLSGATETAYFADNEEVGGSSPSLPGNWWVAQLVELLTAFSTLISDRTTQQCAKHPVNRDDQSDDVADLTRGRFREFEVAPL